MGFLDRIFGRWRRHPVVASGGGLPEEPGQRKLSTVSTKRYWRCPECGSIIPKRPDVLALASTAPQFFALGEHRGGDWCGDCRARQEFVDVYGGRFDLKSSDELIDQMIKDPDNRSCDKKRKLWKYKGKVVD